MSQSPDPEPSDEYSGPIHQDTEDDCQPLNMADSDDDLKNAPIPIDLSPTLAPSESLDQRLNNLVRCVVCDTVPLTSLYQCQFGHLLCAGCFQMRTLDKTLGIALGTCSVCSGKLYRQLPNRNLVAERTLAETKVTCELCGEEMARGLIRKHFQDECKKRLVWCSYRRLGCSWFGDKAAASEHQLICKWPSKTGAELFESLRKREASRMTTRNILHDLMGLLQKQAITVRLVHVLPHCHKGIFPLNEYLKVGSLEAFNQKWALLLKWVTPVDDQVLDSLVCQLRLDSPADCTSCLVLDYTIVSGTYSDVRFVPNFSKRCEFSSEHLLGPPSVIYRNSHSNCVKLVQQCGLYARVLLSCN